MAKQSRPQKKTVERIMHEYKHGELKSGGRRKVKSPKQAIAIALSEAGASKYQSPAEKKRRLQSTKAKEARGETAQAPTEGRGRTVAVRGTATRGSTGRGTSVRGTAARGGAARGATKRGPIERGETARGRSARSTTLRGGAARRTSGRASEMTKAQLYQEAKRRNVPGRSKMSKGELAKAVGAS